MDKEKTILLDPNSPQKSNDATRKQSRLNIMAGTAVGVVAGAAAGCVATASAKSHEDAETHETPDEGQVLLGDLNGIRVAHVDASSFNEAFAQARAQVGAGGIFEYNGRIYGTFTANEWNNMSTAERNSYQSRVNETFSTSFRTEKPASHTYPSHSHDTSYTEPSTEGHISPSTDDSKHEPVTRHTPTPDPTPDPDPDPDPDPTPYPYPEPEPDPTPYPEPEPDPFVMVDPEPSPVPSPDELNILRAEAEILSNQDSLKAELDNGRIEVLGVETHLDDNGRVDTAVHFQHNDQIGLFVDLGSDGKIDVLAVDTNHNQSLDDHEIIPVNENNLATSIFVDNTSFVAQNHSVITNPDAPHDYTNNANLDTIV